MKRKGFFNRIIMFVASFVLVLPFFVDCGLYNASSIALYVSVPSDEQMEWTYPEDIVSQHKYYCMTEWKDGELRLLCSNYPLVCWSSSTAENSLSIGKNNLYDDAYFYTYWSTDNVTWTQGNGSNKGYNSFVFSLQDSGVYSVYSANHDIYSTSGELAFDLSDNSTSVLNDSAILNSQWERFIPCNATYYYEIPEYDAVNYPYYLVVNTYNSSSGFDMLYIVSTEPILLNVVNATDYGQFRGYYYSSGDLIAYKTSDGVRWVEWDSVTPACFWTKSLEDYGLSANDFYCNLVESNHSLYSRSGTLLYSLPSYNNDLGYLSNVVQKSLALTDSYGNLDMSSFKDVISFDEKTTSGVTLNESEYKIRVYEQMCYYSGHTSRVYDDFFPLVQIGEFDIKDMSISYLTQGAFDLTTNSTESRYNAWDILMKNLVRSDNKYYQIVKYNTDGTCEYGGYVKIAHCGDDTKYVSTFDENLKEDIQNGGYIGSDLESGVGSGTNYNDAEIDANEDLSGNGDSVIEDIYGTDELLNSLQGVTDFVGAFPSIIGACLGFLPVWLQHLIYSAIGLGVILFIWKIVR